MAANICCSIEMEPKTLNQGQLNRAREVAADVVQKMEPNEASIVFIDQGSLSRPLVPGNDIDADDQRKVLEEGKQLLYKPVECEEMKTTHIMGRPCQCSCMATMVSVESPDQVGLREPLSAPF
ncbi:uncharacterized protein LOC121261812 [Juglans microcarpa x Juglans regia]|uniref:uncharacterized protein LOC121261812 n=1 Tax=Juglans microcarpa x Juglans regia TaxID=2249226 RepID=UPI001B7F17F4|nr:uncharacterized protein LOC121261812 [Juglans microcarpa x Juglans regia]